MDNVFFNGIQQHEVVISGGVSCSLPFLYYNAYSFSAVFSVRTSMLKALLPSPHLVPLEILPGIGSMVFVAADYHSTSIGPYKELLITIPVRYRPSFNAPLLPLLKMTANLSFEIYVWQLPVTSPLGFQAGIDIWGFPKRLSELDFSETSKTLSCTLLEEGEEVLTLQVKKPKPKKKAEFNYDMFTELNGEILRTPVKGHSDAFGLSMMPGGAQLHMGKHPLAQTIAELKPGMSLQTIFMPDGQLILPEPKEHLLM